VLSGLTSLTTREDLARAAVEALLGSLGDAVDALGGEVARVLVIGGAARNPAVQQLAPQVWGLPVEVPVPGEYVARGAARQAAWALSGAPVPPTWSTVDTERFEAPVEPLVRRQYAVLRDRTEGWD
jgi:xylulokinase